MRYLPPYKCARHNEVYFACIFELPRIPAFVSTMLHILICIALFTNLIVLHDAFQNTAQQVNKPGSYELCLFRLLGKLDRNKKSVRCFLLVCILR
jgi:hypothetical protein